MKGRKRHILVDTMGLLLIVVVHAASIQDRDGAKPVLTKGARHLPRLARIWADGAYAGELVNWVKTTCQCILEIVKRTDPLKGFQVLQRRWVVERTFGWLNRYGASPSRVRGTMKAAGALAGVWYDWLRSSDS